MQIYHNKEIREIKGGKLVRIVEIKGGKGCKTVTKYMGGKKVYSVKKSIDVPTMKHIYAGKFVPGLFKDCIICNKTRKNRK
jgi:hypothetical protein